MTEQQQQQAVEKIRERGMTVAGWARAKGFSLNTVKNVLYRQWGRGDTVGPVAESIIKALRKDGLIVGRK
jgi:lambda repressor-like predicted transcriptional regulator